jgi:hypothetical protein
MGKARGFRIQKGLTIMRLALLILGVCIIAAAPPAGSLAPLVHFQQNDTIVYTMHGINAGRSTTTHYDARAQGVVQQDPAGNFFVEFAWTQMNIEGAPLAFSPATAAFRQRVSIDPGYRFGIPALNVVQPNLIGPITDLLTFYADMQVAMRQTDLRRAGDHAYFKFGMPVSWADGTYTILGQEAIDFDVTLQTIDQKTQMATLVVRHVPPAEAAFTLPVDWMRPAVGSLPNNWVEVQKAPGGKYAAEVGQETFVDTIHVSLARGRIVSASMDNPVDVFARDCDDAALTVCGPPIRYRIRRQITLDAQ